MASSSSGGLTTPRYVRGAADRSTRLLRKTHAIDEDEGLVTSGVVSAGPSVADDFCLQSVALGEASASTSALPSVSFIDAQTLPKPEPVRSCSVSGGDEIMNIGGIDLITNSWLNFANVDSTGLSNISGLGGFTMKQFSTESTTSTTSTTSCPVGSATSLIPPDVPRKSVIQDDIRMNRGRFQLVRKKGRSEVWNLFGQVFDTLSGQRLPYVACYACKVLYTDTGGGTGNMTRHRCPMGTSYRSALSGASSAESAELLNNNQSSFESSHNPPGSTSPEHVNQISSRLPLFFSNVSFHDGFPTTTSAVRESPLAPVQQISLTSSNSSSSAVTSVLHLSTDNPTTSAYIFSDAERKLFIQAVVRFCAQDMQNPDIVEGDGFRQLIETALCIGRSCNELPNYQQLRTLIPSSLAVAEAIERHKSSAKISTSADVAVSLKDYGLALSCRQIQYDDSLFISLWVNYITEDWHLSRRVLSVNKWPATNNLSDIISSTLEDYGFLDAKKIYMTLDRFTEKTARIDLPQRVISSTSIVDVIDEILAQVFMQCRSKCDVEKLSEFCVRVIELFARLNLLPLLPHKLPASLTARRSGSQSYALFVYPLLLFVRQQFPQIQYFLEAHAGLAELAKEASNIDWSHVNDIETFLEPFHETVQIFTDNKIPHYHKLFPEWFALIHECSEVEDEELPNADGTPAAPPPPKGSPFLIGLRYSANLLLKKWADDNMLIEHHMATVLNPRLKHLPVICSDVQRTSIYNHIRALIGCSKLKKERSCDTPEGEPPRKRRNFLISLEDSSMDEDELGCYLRTSFSASQTKDILEFWSTVGEAQFPRLSRLARFLLASTAAAPSVQLSVSDSKLTERNLHNLLLLRSAYGL
ncbi:hypothetical protein L596_005189 [Steinernema carpocapsae]|uniref:BED-type domain-containing protein n=1 Tax=Steinernema carpocapsae TaxID=34508 RepID=A0A4U8UY59_STECR|nr:hypothetical protein L596_005189 [Steinernema carpocapsae]